MFFLGFRLGFRIMIFTLGCFSGGKTPLIRSDFDASSTQMFSADLEDLEFGVGSLILCKIPVLDIKDEQHKEETVTCFCAFKG